MIINIKNFSWTSKSYNENIPSWQIDIEKIAETQEEILENGNRISTIECGISIEKAQELYNLTLDSIISNINIENLKVIEQLQNKIINMEMLLNITQ